MTDRALDALARLATVPRLLVASDFDGTLAPLAPKPWLAAADGGAVGALVGLAALPATEVALVSARTLDDLGRQAGALPGVRLVGSYGAESADGPVGLTDGELRRWTQLVVAFERLAMTDDAAWVERKTVGVALHTRGMGDSGALLTRAAEAAAGVPEVQVVRGSEVLEAVVRPVSKAWVVDDLARRLTADAVLYLGDDHADEDVFAGLSSVDLGVHVGHRQTQAAMTVPDPAAAGALLARLEALRRVWLAAVAGPGTTTERTGPLRQDVTMQAPQDVTLQAREEVHHAG